MFGEVEMMEVCLERVPARSRVEVRYDANGLEVLVAITNKTVRREVVAGYRAGIPKINVVEEAVEVVKLLPKHTDLWQILPDEARASVLSQGACWRER